MLFVGKAYASSPLSAAAPVAQSAIVATPMVDAELSRAILDCVTINLLCSKQAGSQVVPASDPVLFQLVERDIALAGFEGASDVLVFSE